MRTALSIVFIIHGMAHLPGFLVPWRLAALDSMPYTTKVLGGTADLGPVGIRALSILWLVAALAFIGAGASTLLGDSAWYTLAVTAIMASLSLTILGCPQSQAGLFLNILLLTYLLLGPVVGWLPEGPAPAGHTS
jgi:hypothetical protein